MYDLMQLAYLIIPAGAKSCVRLLPMASFWRHRQQNRPEMLLMEHFSRHRQQGSVREPMKLLTFEV
jgi:hypothetical protein